MQQPRRCTLAKTDVGEGSAQLLGRHSCVPYRAA
jgi:hypothetical protein